MLKRTTAAGMFALAALATAAPASAQNFSFEFNSAGPRYGYQDGYRDSDRRALHRTLSPQQVRRILRDKGFRQIDYVDRRGSIYQVRATTQRGRRVGLVVSARNGAILNRYRL